MNIETLMPYIQQVLLWMFLFSVLMVGIIVYLRIAANVIKDWPSVQGKVTGSRVAYDSSTSKTGAIPYVTYVYEVNGKTYKDGHLFPGIFTVSGQTSAEKVVARYPRGADVTVYYNPKKPSEAYLEKTSKTQIGGMCGILILGNLLMPLIVLMVDYIKPTMGH